MIESERLNFKAVDESDIEWLRESRNANKDNFFDSHEITTEQQKSWYQRYKESGVDHMFIVKLKSTGENIGTIAIYDLDITKRMAILGRVLLLEEFRGKGYAEEMVKRLVRYAFDTMRLYKLKVEVHYNNIDAIVIYYKSGFKPITKPILMLERLNENINWDKPLIIESYDNMSKAGYEGQNSNMI